MCHKAQTQHLAQHSDDLYLVINTLIYLFEIYLKFMLFIIMT